MPKFKFAKLVRDKIVQQQLESGAQPVYRTLSDHEHKQALVAKIQEEAREILEASSEEVAQEIADVQQALDDLREKFGLSSADIAEAQAKKSAKNGDFKAGHYVETVMVAADNPWAEYYRSQADRYPEIDS